MELGTAPSLEQLDELCAEDTFKEALGRWLAGGAVIWNTWQKGFAAIRARYLESDPEATGPVGVAYPTWSQSVWCELSEGVGSGMEGFAEGGQEGPTASPKRRTSFGPGHRRS